ncbi:threonine aldolase family protein [Candidatus Phycosocius spiralis]|uniref:L-threonine aldolase n=1 Tax=Candidatus Phycosocius spiralis TaxID=2815099 RepID=A0ABQ4PYH1_9PROT|nr:beta-eliminating lyase-related protein [Candidatus Phycosocius spiralis]GIU68130.1 L-threonine aldolase [Candidatus Phycosocius spiralis]
MFGSDNQAPAHPKVLDAIIEANQGRCGSYGDDPWTARATEALYTVFESDDLDMYCVGTGGSANGLALSVLCPPWGAVLAHPQAHILEDEGNGPEFFTSGARMVSLGCASQLVMPADLEQTASRHAPTFVHGIQPRVLTLTNLSELGQVYRPDHLRSLQEVCARQGWSLHVDGARFANAVVAFGASAADLSWRSGVDALSFGLTKNGALAAEVLILFGAARSAAAPYLRKRAGQLFSKHRYLSAQIVAMLEDGLWLDLAIRANQTAHALAQILDGAGAKLALPVEGNEVFAHLTELQVKALCEAEIGFFPWGGLGPDTYRFVASWHNDAHCLEAVAKALQRNEVPNL